MDLKAVRDLVHSLIVALSVAQAALLAIEKLLGPSFELRLSTRPPEGRRNG